MSLGNSVGMVGAFLVAGMTLILLMKEFAAPWLVQALKLKSPPRPTRMKRSRFRGVHITFGQAKGGNGP